MTPPVDTALLQPKSLIPSRNTVNASKRLRLLVVGDSIAAGAASVRGAEIVARVTPTFVELLRERLSWEILTDAAARRRTADLVPSFDQLIQHHAPDAVFVTTGGNDVDPDWRRLLLSDGAVIRSGTLLPRYAEALRCIGAAADRAAVPLLFGDLMGSAIECRLPFLSGLAGRDVRPIIEAAGGQARCDEIVRSYRDTMNVVAGEVGASVVRFGTLFDPAHNPDLGPGISRDLVGDDGMHPSKRGHRVLCDGLTAPLRGLLAGIESKARQRAAGVA